jgi:hypothetical protein
VRLVAALHDLERSAQSHLPPHEKLELLTLEIGTVLFWLRELEVGRHLPSRTTEPEMSSLRP